MAVYGCSDGYLGRLDRAGSHSRHGMRDNKGAHAMQALGRLNGCWRARHQVVCAGAKSILDIALTLEYLETQGVSVIGYGTDEFPAFLTRSSGHAAPLRMDSPDEVARTIYINDRLRLNSGIVLACPIPEAEAAESETIERATTEALRQAEYVSCV